MVLGEELIAAVPVQSQLHPAVCVMVVYIEMMDEKVRVVEKAPSSGPELPEPLDCGLLGVEKGVVG